jgi:hypothetical protein
MQLKMHWFAEPAYPSDTSLSVGATPGFEGAGCCTMTTALLLLLLLLLLVDDAAASAADGGTRRARVLLAVR